MSILLKSVRKWCGWRWWLVCGYFLAAVLVFSPFMIMWQIWPALFGLLFFFVGVAMLDSMIFAAAVVAPLEWASKGNSWQSIRILAAGMIAFLYAQAHQVLFDRFEIFEYRGWFVVVIAYLVEAFKLLDIDLIERFG